MNIMKNLNQLLKLPVLKYDLIDKSNFEKNQIDKILEEIEEFETEKDYLKKCCECLDVIQVSFSLLELFNQDIIDQAWRLHNEKLKKKKSFEIKGIFEIFQICNRIKLQEKTNE